MNEKILFFIPDFSMGGAENMMINLGNYCYEKKIPIGFIVMNNNGSLKKRMDINIPVYSLNSKRMLFAVFRLYRFIIHNKPKLILSTLYQANLAAIIVKILSFMHLTTIIRVESNMTQLLKDKEKFSVFLKIFNPFFQILYRKADKIIAVSKNIEEDLSINFGIKNIITIYNPAITKDFHDKSISEITESWWPANSKVVISVGRLDPVKDFPTLIKAFKNLNVPNTKLVILGEGKMYQELINLASHLKISTDVILPGFVDNPIKFIKKSSVFVLPSKYEGFSNALIEAIACHVPVIASDCKGGNSEILSNGKYGDLFPVGNIEILGSLLAKNLDKGIQKKIPGNWIEKFHYKKIFDQYISLILSFSN